MKYIKLLILMCCMVLSMTSCDDMSFLQIKPDDLVLTEDSVKTPEHLQKFGGCLSKYSRCRIYGW